jgi:NAD(P)-dependent dehydrogenase (short-subunit alcohol dehydrogenase family)
MRLQDKIALVTGAGQGIGKGIALRLAQEGADVAVNYPYTGVREKAEDTAAQIRAYGRKALVVQADVSNSADVQQMINSTIENFGKLDILVNNAGVDVHVPFLEMTEEEWDYIIDVNLKGNFLCSQAAARAMLMTGGGKIVIISSIHSMQTYQRITAYAAAKGGLNAMTRQLALELAPYHINVNCVAPGSINVEKYVDLIPDFDVHMFDHEIPLGSIGYPEDIAGAVVYFASDDARWVTGQVLVVDGGTSARLLLGVSDKDRPTVNEIRTMTKQDWEGNSSQADAAP